ncbi:carboxymethylenebutenolidase [Mycobacterium sp. CBMA 234]|uniref:dienelactone hydrolase family protein n=1 Tax=Mycolicibacterium sp. CBMA 234 TaxID=1918495 RepID=UPI0012DE2CDE|nr:dienelactone hydrolase family protein [Mycolicibacterium sp. CBMA 234]MUL68281.1 carboxymethylenebutenolidase [Mycolicibacterium sp. CBMA 234]
MPAITYPATTGPIPGYLATPEGPGPWPAVVVIQDVRGLTADIRRSVDRFANAGYLALAPDLYGGHSPKVVCVAKTIRSHFTGKGPAYDDIEAARTYLLKDPRCTGKVGIAGFCMGGGFALVVASRGGFSAAASMYGLAPEDIATLEQSCPVVASYGTKDLIAKPGTAQQIRTTLSRAGVAHDIKEYNVGHSFMNDFGLPRPLKPLERLARMEFSEPEAEDSWRRVFTFFDQHLT